MATLAKSATPFGEVLARQFCAPRQLGIGNLRVRRAALGGSGASATTWASVASALAFASAFASAFAVAASTLIALGARLADVHESAAVAAIARPL